MLFTSSREKWLWFWSLVAVATIYATLGIAPTWAGFLRERGLLVPVFVGGMALVAATAAAHGLRSHASRSEFIVALAVGTVYWMVLVRISNPAERTHLIEYGVVAILVYEALRERARHRPIRLPSLLAVGGTSAAGLLDEFIQGWLPNRVFAWEDVLFNCLAAGMAVAASAALRTARNWRRPESPHS